MTENLFWRWVMGRAASLAGYATSFLLLAFMLKCLIISGYCLLLYGGVRLVKKLWGHKLSVRANYYSWYALLLSFPMSGLGFNNRIKLPFYDLFFAINYYPPIDVEASGWLIRISHLLRLLLMIVTVIWLVSILVKCMRQIATNIWLWRAIRRQRVLDDQYPLKQQAAAAFGLRGEKFR